MSVKALLSTDNGPRLYHMLEDAVLLGGAEELEHLLSFVPDELVLSPELLQELDGLRRHREHYEERRPTLSELERQKICQYDMDWSMRLLRRLSEEVG